MRRWVPWLVAVIAVVVVVGAALRVPAVQDAIIRRVVARAVADSAGHLFADDALRVLLCGTSAPLPHPTRAKACVAVFAAGRFWIVDTGPGSWNHLALWHVDGKRIGAILYTHFHSDHIAELGEFNLQTWAAGRPNPLRVIGPPGVERVVAGFEEAYALDRGYRIAHHGADFLKPDLSLMQATPVDATAAPAVVLDEDGLKITAFPVDHRPIVPAYGYRFDYRGRTRRRCPGARGASESSDRDDRRGGGRRRPRPRRQDHARHPELPHEPGAGGGGRERGGRAAARPLPSQ